MSIIQNVHRRSFLGIAGAGVAAGQTATVTARRRAAEQIDTDVVIAGGGPAGIGAALAAARTGAKVLLVERHAFFGGVGAWGVGMTINQMRPENQPRGAIHEMVINRVASYGDDALRMEGHAMVCNVEYLKVALMDTLDEAGCKYFLHCRVADAIVERGRVAGMVVSTKEGLKRIRAKVAIDATGDADLAFFAGAETMKDPALSPMTLNMIVVNVDVPAALEALRGGGAARILKQARAKYPLLPESMGLARLPIRNALNINHAGTKQRGPLDATRPEDMTEAERFSRRQALQITAALREFGGPAFANVQLGTTGAQTGVRETRRVKGLYVLTEDDAKSGRKFEDAVAWRSGFLDIGYVRYEKMKVHDVPYRAILPEKLDGLLVAGRCISASHVAASAGKSMGNCMATGHAAGLAAAMCAAKLRQPREIKVPELQQALARDGVQLNRAGQEGSAIGGV